jgi:hypothetical protein
MSSVIFVFLSSNTNLQTPNSKFVIARFMRATHFSFRGEKDGLPGQAGQ